MWNETCLILIFIFQHFYPLKMAEIVVKCEIEMRPAPPPSLMNSGHRSKLKVVLALGIQCFKFLKQGTSTRQKALVSRWIQVSFWFWNSCRQEQRVTLRKRNSAKMLTNLYWLTTWTVNNSVIQIGTCTTLIFSQNKIRCLAYQKAKENLTVWLYKPRKTLNE